MKTKIFIILLVLALGVGIGLGGMSYFVKNQTDIEDFSTDLDDPPQFIAIAKISENKNEDLKFPYESKKSLLESGKIPKSLKVENPKRDAFNKCLQLARNQTGWQILSADPSEGLIEGTYGSAFFDFKHDFSIRIRQVDDKNSQIDMRSRSRSGFADQNVNLTAIEGFFNQLTK